MVKALIALRLAAWLTALVLVMFWMALLAVITKSLIDVGLDNDGWVYLLFSLLGMVSVFLAMRRNVWGRLSLFLMSIVVVWLTLVVITSLQPWHMSEGRSGLHPDVKLALWIGPLLVLMHLWLAAYPSLESMLTKRLRPVP
jgi:hypothetical protein